MIIAIDGPAGAGKSTVAKLVAKSLKFLYIDTGAMYRALTLRVLEEGVAVEETGKIIQLAQASNITLLNNPDAALKVFLNGRDVSGPIRAPGISALVSDVAKIKEVRSIMVELQRKLGSHGDVVLDGRDIGTVVFPCAEKKFYVDADFKERTRRRYKELICLNPEVTLENVAEDLANRDKIDTGRECAPLKKADDAVYIDTTHLNIEEVVNKLLGLING